MQTTLELPMYCGLSPGYSSFCMSDLTLVSFASCWIRPGLHGQSRPNPKSTMIKPSRYAIFLRKALGLG